MSWLIFYAALAAVAYAACAGLMIWDTRRSHRTGNWIVPVVWGFLFLGLSMSVLPLVAP